MSNIHQAIEDILRFMQTDGFEALPAEVRTAVSVRNSELCLEYVLPQLKGLHRNKYKGCYAPHKPVMMMAVMELIAEGKIMGPVVIADKELKDRFRRIWELYVPDGSPFNCDWHNPFIYLDYEEFWTLGNDNAHATLTLEMFLAMKNESNRQVISSLLIDMIKNDTVSEEYARLHPVLSSKAAEEIMPFVVALNMLGWLIA